MTYKHHERPYEGQTNVWLTPPELVNRLGPFDLDPCAPVDRPWDTAAKHYTELDDGLSKRWEGLVWCNPPYGPHTWTWLYRMAEHNNGIALVFARTETSGFFETAWDQADSMLFMRRRIRFYRTYGTQAGGSGAPSVLLGYGTTATNILRHRGPEGAFISDWLCKRG